MNKLRLAGSVALLIIGGVAVRAAAPPAKPTSTPATATFRCLTTDPLCESGDRVRDDGASYITSGSISSGVFGVQIAAPRALFIDLVSNLIDGSRSCAAIFNCNPHGPLAGQVLNLADASLRVKPLTLVSSTYQDLAGGLTAMRCDNPNPVPGLVDFTFWMPDGDGHWGLNFNPKEYPGTSAASVTRDSPMMWTVQVTAGINNTDVGELLSWAHSSLKGKNGPSHEGRFHVPSKVTITAAAATCPA